MTSLLLRLRRATRAMVAAALLFTGACGGSTHAVQPPASPPAPPAGKTRPPSPVERRGIDELFDIAARVRELQFVKKVPVEVHDRDAITHHLLEEMEEEDLDKARVVYGNLGLLDPDADLQDLLLRVLGEQVVGYYDPRTGQLVVRDDVIAAMEAASPSPAAFAEARVVLVHELVHALQDQHLDLSEHYELDRSSDAENAFRAVVEGDASLAMISYILEHGGAKLGDVTQAPGLLRGLVGQASPLPGAELEAAPAILRVTLVSAYVEGLLFAAEMHGRRGWKAVNEAHRAPPISTEQILHPAKYLRQELPDQVTIPKLEALEKAGYRVFDEDTLGELEMQVYLGQGSSTDVDARAAQGWGGDRLRTYVHDSAPPASVWFTSWDDEDEAQQAGQAAYRIAERLQGREKSRSLVRRLERALLIVRGLPPTLHPPVLRAFNKFARALPAHPPTQ